MCGIIGYSGKETANQILIDGLAALSYRGYDSAGVALQSNNQIVTIKTRGRVAELEQKLAKYQKKSPLNATCGIGHTRWATHGEPSDKNAHPHTTPNLALVHNGIIENCQELRKELTDAGYKFQSETDSEAAAFLIDQLYQKSHNPAEAIIATCNKIIGSFAFAVVFRDQPGKIFAIRRGSPLIVAKNHDGAFLASDITAIAGHATEFARLDENILVEVALGEISAQNLQGKKVQIEFKPVELTDNDVSLGDYPHFMLKEICEEPVALQKTIEAYLNGFTPTFPTPILQPESLRKIDRIRIVACGTAMHAGLIGQKVIEKLARIPVHVEIASEFRYSHPIIGKNELMIVISQSGETADTLAALRFAKSVKLPVLAICNTPGSTIAEEADGVIYTEAGPEIAVASTKAYSVQCAVLYILAVQLGLARGELAKFEAEDFIKTLRDQIPGVVAEAGALSDAAKKLAKTIAPAEHLFYIGRTIDYALCCEASLKLKEISYIHSEAFPAGELKHGTISLITDDTPVIAFLTAPAIYDKTISGIREAAARGAKIFIIATPEIAAKVDFGVEQMIVLPKIDDEKAHKAFSSADFAVFPAATALQLIAYHAALAKGNDVDKPRNLAKSVTVE